MRLAHLAMPGLHTTLMGVLKGALDYHGLEFSAPMVFGLSGHAFLINIHHELCPSGPYCWRAERMEPLISNLGLRRTNLGTFGPAAGAAQRAAVEARLRAALDRGIPCALLDTDHQLITGYDRDGFDVASPWPDEPDTPARLSFGSWREFGEEFGITFHTLGRCAPAAEAAAVAASLEYAADLYRDPAAHALDGYGVGPAAYANWIAAVAERAGSHGNWWNATVWAECREMAARYLGEIAERYDLPGSAGRAGELYAGIADALRRVADRGLAAAPKGMRLREAAALEARAIGLVAAAAQTLRGRARRAGATPSRAAGQ